MANISFRERHSALFRIWHWSNFLVITGLLLTVLLRKTLLSYRANAVILQTKLHDFGVTLTEEQAQHIAKVFRDNLWEWHINLGLVLSGLFVLRVIVEIFTNSERKLLRKILRGFAFLSAPKIDKKEAWHYFAVKAGYAIFYLCLGVMVITGLSLTYEENLKLGETLADNIKEIHEFLMYFFIVFICGHLLGVTYMELSKAPGLVSDMFNGGKD
jgi:cytochrome b561